MISDKKVNKKTPIERVFGPLDILKDVAYLGWLVYILIASLQFFSEIIQADFSFLSDNTLYYISLSILMPAIIDFITEIYEKWQNNKENLFIKYKVSTFIIAIIIILIIILFLSSNVITIYIQLPIYIISIILSVYMFCVSKLKNRYDKYKWMDKPEFSEIEQERSKEISNKAKNTNVIKNNNGKEIKL